MQTKVCTKCKEEKNLTDFCKEQARKDGLANHCRVCKGKAYKEWHHRNLEKKKSYKRKWDEDNREENLDKWRRYHSSNKAKRNQQSREYYSRNQESEKSRAKDYRAANPDKVYEWSAARRSRLSEQITECVDPRLVRDRDDTCYLCGVPFTVKERYDPKLTHVDHKTPISRGGEHSYENCALTHASCNLRKNDKTPEEYWAQD